MIPVLLDENEQRQIVKTIKQLPFVNDETNGHTLLFLSHFDFIRYILNMGLIPAIPGRCVFLVDTFYRSIFVPKKACFGYLSRLLFDILPPRLAGKGLGYSGAESIGDSFSKMFA